MNLIILQPGEVDPAGTACLSDHRADHALTVLKVAAGDGIRVGQLDGPLGIAIVQSIEGRTIVLRCRFDTAVAPRPPVDLLLAVPRPKVMRRLWAQIAALGVGQIILTHASKVERQYFDTHWLEPPTFRPLLIEGLQQAKDTRMPRVSIHRRLKVLVEDELDALVGSGARILADSSAARSPGAIIRAQTHRRLLLAVGPEGGWNEFERDLFAAHGFEAIGLGPRTLRTDTACVALLAVVHAALADIDGGDLKS